MLYTHRQKNIYMHIHNSACNLISSPIGNTMKEVSKDVMIHLKRSQEFNNVKYTGMLVRGELRSAKHTEPLLTVME